ncbi:uncharacterized protein A4U43_C02F710 [Asparagus officinalis]|uniref:Uncharacterized protein n=1 Tax=Asparagus officinalis TaxID=4686 RepID=A0A5P1FJW2_ASPOF|nr:uncharacterized protein LOC109829344 isoform X1 [Asparagus officinalis]ONK76870.1 uncharacterized protein A4U43_C02F710 [Asparagus officinalis]
MEDNKKAAKAFVDNYFPVKQPKSRFPDVLNDLFPPNSQQEASKREGYGGQSSNAVADGYSRGKANSVVYFEVSEPCSMGSSVDYGCRDNYYPNRQPGNFNEKKKDKNDGYEYLNPENSRGEWWQGSLYY